MSPLQLFLFQLITLLFCMTLEKAHKAAQGSEDSFTTAMKMIGGLCFLSMFVTAIWAVVYYL